MCFAGLGFLVDNLYDEFKRLPPLEYINIWVCVIVYLLTSNLIYGVMMGFGFAFFLFERHYSGMGAVKAVIHGCDFEGNVIRSETERRKLEHLSHSK